MSSTQISTLAAGRSIELARCSVVVLSGEHKGTEVLIGSDVFRVGKSPDSDLVLRDSTVSRNHCEIVRDAKGFLLRDLGSTNGTLIDGAEVREAYLLPGAVIRIGHVDVKVRPYAERIELSPSERERFGEVVGAAESMREVFGLMERLAPTDATILIGGETGTGKDALALSIHAASKRAKGPFVVVDCGAVVGSLIESELFGHEKGAFTGAVEKRQGAFELAARGTLFLDEIGELPLELQPKLLRALETRRIRRVGGSQELSLDFRVIAASNRNLQMEVARGKFREDLYFRLAVVPVRLPPLRERRADIAVLAKALLTTIQKQLDPNAKPLSLTTDVIESLTAHDWPGNVRELRNVLERAVYLAQAQGHTTLASIGMPTAAAVATPSESTHEFDATLSYRDTREHWEADFERRYVEWLLNQHDGNMSAAARAADMDRKHLHKLAKKHGLREG